MFAYIGQYVIPRFHRNRFEFAFGFLFFSFIFIKCCDQWRTGVVWASAFRYCCRQLWRRRRRQQHRISSSQSYLFGTLPPTLAACLWLSNSSQPCTPHVKTVILNEKNIFFFCSFSGSQLFSLIFFFFARIFVLSLVFLITYYNLISPRRNEKWRD